MHILSGKLKCIDISREREMCVLFEFRHFFNSENSSTYFKVLVYLCKNNLIDEMSLSDCITLQTAFVQMAFLVF